MAPAAKKQKRSDGGVTIVEAGGVEDVQQTALDSQSLPEIVKAEQQRRSLFVRSLPANTTSDTLTELFSESYPIKHATAVIDPATKQCKGYGFVTFADAEDAQRAKVEFNGRILQDRKLRVELAERRQREEGGEKTPRVKPEREVQAPPKLIVRNLPWTIKGSKQLEKLFLSYGKVKQAYVPQKGPGLMAGFGFVLMRGRKNAEKAMQGVNGKEVDGRTLAVDWAVEKGVYQGLEEKPTQDAPEGSGAEDADVEEGVEDAQFGDALEDISSNGTGSDVDDDDEDGVDVDMDGEEEVDDPETKTALSDDRSSTLFVRNLPFTCADEDLEDHFRQFGTVRYARVVLDHETNRPKGTGFVCFYDTADADACLRNAPRRSLSTEKTLDGKHVPPPKSILQNENTDPSGQYSLDGRVLQISPAVDKSEASRLTKEGATYRSKRDKDKRRLYLLSEGTIASNSKLWEQLPPSERTMREASVKQRKTLIESNPSLNLSLTRLSVRNIPRSIGSKELKALAREAVVGFATDLKSGLRQRLSREELERGGEEMKNAELVRKQAGKGIVRQAKVVFEGGGGSKVSEETGAGRSRGYGFIEYYTHRSALMALRWLNGHAVGYRVQEGGVKGGKANGRPSVEDVQDRKKRLVVEFAIENAQVVMRRSEKEEKARERSQMFKDRAAAEGEADEGGADRTEKSRGGAKAGKDFASGPLGKRKTGVESTEKPGSKSEKGRRSKPGSASTGTASSKVGKAPEDEKITKRNQIIGRKRAARKVRKGGKA
ncbi:RNA recognition motif-containing protein [Friedmanniomyces endolithicus]|nr:RNA recognition motif-containing protein [Friedmanniomyces endolithicus]